MAKRTRATSEATGLGWWGQRCFEYFLDEILLAPLSDGQLRSAARSEARLRVEKGSVHAYVPVGNYGNEELASFKVKPLGERDWKRALDAIAADTDVAHRVLSGSFGSELEAAFAAAGITLFPTPSARSVIRCTCRERSGCRHANVLAVHTALACDANPFLWLEVLGRPRVDLLAAIQARLVDSGHTRGADQEAALTEAALDGRAIAADRFWETPVDPDAIPVRPGEAVAHDGLLRLLGPVPLPGEAAEVEVAVEQEVEGFTRHVGTHKPLDEVLRAYLTQIAGAAHGLATGDRTPVYLPEQVPGKPVPVAERLSAEVAEAVRREGRPLSLQELQELCPTAAAVPEDVEAHWQLSQALHLLPPDMVSLAGAFASPRAGLLTGAVFRHVITFDEWFQGGLAPGADWVLALQIAGHQPPFQVQADGRTFTAPGEESLFVALQPQVGDELLLTVADPDRPLLTATLRGRGDRPAGMHQESLAAARFLVNHMATTSPGSLSEEDAVALLLGAGAYREGRCPDPIALLPLQQGGLYYGTGGQGLSSQYNPWQPAFLRRGYGYWPERENALRWFTVMLANRGESRQRVEEALACVRWWCDTAPGAHDSPAGAPSLGTLLYFLWLVAPGNAEVRRIDSKRVPSILASWFTLLADQYPPVRAAYGRHLAACGAVDLFMHRLKRLPEARDEAALRAWQVEGLRWIGPAWCRA